LRAVGLKSTDFDGGWMRRQEPQLLTAVESHPNVEKHDVRMGNLYNRPFNQS
jgi:hypothetical protein